MALVIAKCFIENEKLIVAAIASCFHFWRERFKAVSELR